MTTEIERGTTYRVEADVKDADGTLVDPDQSGGTYQITITITNVTTSTVDVNAVTMTRDSTGQFHYDWETSSSGQKGQYEVEVSATVSSKTVLNRDYIDLVDVV